MKEIKARIEVRNGICEVVTKTKGFRLDIIDYDVMDKTKPLIHKYKENEERKKIK